jgi:hypothetical protein
MMARRTPSGRPSGPLHPAQHRFSKKIKAILADAVWKGGLLHAPSGRL